MGFVLGLEIVVDVGSAQMKPKNLWLLQLLLEACGFEVVSVSIGGADVGGFGVGGFDVGGLEVGFG